MEPRPWHQSYDEGVPATLEYPRLRLDEILTKTAQGYPDKDALIFYGKAMTYRELDAQADLLAAALQDLGLEQGDRVSVFMPNIPQAVISYEAIWRAGGVAACAERGPPRAGAPRRPPLAALAAVDTLRPSAPAYPRFWRTDSARPRVRQAIWCVAHTSATSRGPA